MALAGFGAALVAVVFVIVTAQRAPEPVVVATPAAPAKIKVHVVGEVVWPGQYLLPAGAHVQDAIFAAHGPTLIADLNRVNLAAVLRDGDRVVVPRIIQPAYPFPQAGRPSSVKPPPGGTRPVADAPARGRTHPKPAKLPSKGEGGEHDRTVNVNTATAADLDRLPGIGPVLARRIVAYREQQGLYRRLDELLNVEGFGRKLLQRLEPSLRLE
jgi:competence protein ComEA